MDGMQRYRDIKANADPEDPMTKLRLTVVVACDQALVEAIRLERQGRPGKVRALGFTETADLLDQMTSAGRCGNLAPTIALLANSTQPTCGLTAGHAGWHRSEGGGEWGAPTP